MNRRTDGDLTATALATLHGAGHAQAHGCDGLWASAYNITVRSDGDAWPGEVAAACLGRGR